MSLSSHVHFLHEILKRKQYGDKLVQTAKTLTEQEIHCWRTSQKCTTAYDRHDTVNTMCREGFKVKQT